MVDNTSKYNLNISILRISFKKLLLCLMWINITMWCPQGTAHGEALSKVSRQSIETRHTIVQYGSLKDIKRFDSKIDYSPGEGGFKSLFSGTKCPIDSVKKKVDAVFERAQEILDMRGRVKKVVINICSKKHFNEVRNRVVGKKSRIRSWYLFENNTIYINAYDVHDGILAHEMAHAIVNHYMTVRPPRATAEILARYVDKHLYF